MPATPDALFAGSGTVLAFDVGTRNIGVAVGNSIAQTARALTTLAAGDETGLAGVVAEWRPDCFVVGLPLSLDGLEQRITVIARAFASDLEARFARPTYLVDERYSSIEASRRFAAERARGGARRKDAAALDAYAAAVILESWFGERGRPAS